MKLETGYRRLYKHRWRWDINTRFDQDFAPYVSVDFRHMWPDEMPEENITREFWCRSLGQSWSDAALYIEACEKAIDLYRQAREATPAADAAESETDNAK